MTLATKRHKKHKKKKASSFCGRILFCAFCAFSWPRTSFALEIIAHRGASAQRPENTLEAEALAQKQGADWLEADVVSTKDHQLILSHDLWLDATTNIEARFPGRGRRDGHFYALDFSLSQLRTLTLRPRVEPDGRRAFPKRNIGVAGARICTLRELLALKNGAGGFYLEPKAPRWHRQRGVDVSQLMLREIARASLSPRRVWLECFDPGELKRLRFLKSPFRQSQLIGRNSDVFDPGGQGFDFDAMRSPAGLRAVKGYADAIGPRLDFVVSGAGGVSPLVALAHAAGLQVHPFVFQTDIFPFAPPFSRAWIRAFEAAHIEAIFTDQPGEVRALLSTHGER